MKWQIWIEPNKIIEEEYPNGWTYDDVFEAASNRWANKVTTVNPAPTGIDYEKRNNTRYGNTNSSSSFTSVSLPSFGGLIKAIVVGGVVMWGLQFVPNKETQPTINSAPEVVETIQQTNTNSNRGLIQRWEERSNQIDTHRNEFFNTSYQEEAIDDLGQDWDK